MLPFIVHAIVTSLGLLLISKVLRGFEIANWLAALFVAVVIGGLHALVVPFAESFGRMIGKVLASVSVSYSIAVVLLLVIILLVDAAILKLAATFSPGVRISGFMTIVLAALLLVAFNWIVGEVLVRL